ncbi:MAG: cell division protein ZapA [Gammaproteobacteria bacterium]
MTNGILVKILGKDFQINCPPGSEGALLAAAQHLDKIMKDIRNSGKVISFERIAVMAALNISYDLLHGSSEQKNLCQHLQHKIEQVLIKPLIPEMA